jgi:hypothetical protein
MTDDSGRIDDGRWPMVSDIRWLEVEIENFNEMGQCAPSPFQST